MWFSRSSAMFTHAPSPATIINSCAHFVVPCQPKMAKQFAKKLSNISLIFFICSLLFHCSAYLLAKRTGAAQNTFRIHFNTVSKQKKFNKKMHEFLKSFLFIVFCERFSCTLNKWIISLRLRTLPNVFLFFEIFIKFICLMPQTVMPLTDWLTDWV